MKTINGKIVGLQDPANSLDGMNKETADAAAATLLLVPTVNNAPSHALQTVAAAANGFQLSSTRPSMVNYNVSVSSTATIAGAATGSVVLEIAATNSVTATDWKTIGVVGNSQTVTLAIALQSIQVISGQVGGFVPAGWYVRLRSITTTGTVSFSYLSGQEAVC